VDKTMARKKTIKLAKIKKEPKKFKLFLDCGEKYESEADTFKEALTTIYKDSFGKIKTWGVFILETDGKKSQIQLRPIQIKRAFLGHFAQDLLEKRMMMALKSK